MALHNRIYPDRILTTKEIQQRYNEKHPRAIADAQKRYRERRKLIPEKELEAKRKAKEYRKNNPEKIKEINRKSVQKRRDKVLFTKAKYRAKQLGLEFNITLEDISFPEICPILNIILEFGNRGLKDNSPSIDRIDNTKGYIKGNVHVISWRANRIKCDASLEEIEKLYLYMKEKMNEPDN